MYKRSLRANNSFDDNDFSSVRLGSTIENSLKTKQRKSFKYSKSEEMASKLVKAQLTKIGLSHGEDKAD